MAATKVDIVPYSIRCKCGAVRVIKIQRRTSKLPGYLKLFCDDCGRVIEGWETEGVNPPLNNTFLTVLIYISDQFRMTLGRFLFEIAYSIYGKWRVGPKKFKTYVAERIPEK